MKTKKLISAWGWVFTTVFIATFILMAFFGPYYVARVWWTSEEFKDTGQIGDTIGGIAGPLISALSAILVYLAFREQAKGNRILQDHYRSDRANSVISRVEKYLPMFEQIVEKFQMPYITPSLKRLFIASFEKEQKKRDYDCEFRNGFEEKLKKLKSQQNISIGELEILSRDLRYVIGILMQSTKEIMGCSNEDKGHFLLLYEIYFKVELQVFKELVKYFPSEDEVAKRFTNDVVSEIVRLENQVSALTNSLYTK